MKEEKHQEIIKEVLEEIESSITDKRGLVSHQRRLAFIISLGAANILKLYFHKNNVIKEGSIVNHLWFKRKKEKIIDQLQNQLTSPINSLNEINKILEIIIKIEEKRDDLAYGAPASERILQEKINLFFELRKLTKC